MRIYDKMKNISQIVANTLDEIESYILPGITTKEIDRKCAQILQKYGAKSSALRYKGFPANVCVSVNTEVCHGIPGNRILQSGDIVSVDIVANKDGYHGDSCRTFLIPNRKDPLTNRKRFLIKTTYECMWNAIKIIKDGIRVGDLGHAMESYAHEHSLQVVKDFCGHGIGINMHQEPYIPFYGTENTGEIIKAGTYITIEPMLIDGPSNQIFIKKDGWTAVSEQQHLSAQFEHTVLVKEKGYEVLSFNKNDQLHKKSPCN